MSRMTYDPNRDPKQREYHKLLQERRVAEHIRRAEELARRNDEAAREAYRALARRMAAQQGR